jgi:hypothetical protein
LRSFPTQTPEGIDQQGCQDQSIKQHLQAINFHTDAN